MHYNASLEKCQKPLAAGWNMWKGAALTLLFLLCGGEMKRFTTLPLGIKMQHVFKVSSFVIGLLSRNMK